ncbi:phage tail protein [Flavobacterium plurextorum]|uniref:Phage tail protein n=2 Tax=Flavobacterium plurextorum TaxID=1114867 RepID=A0ABX4CVB5_9FLAO|nr:phage tail protein [Flavobacterium plurextorum]
MFAGTFAPRGWLFCNGQLLPIPQYSTLFSIIGTTYGGDGINNFALPDLRGRVPVGQGQGPGLSPRNLGETSGNENVTLTISNMPAHNHQLNASTAVGTSNVPTGNVLANTSVLDKEYNGSPNTAMNNASIGISGSNAPVTIMQPFQTINFIIAIEGIYPPRP